MASSNINPEQEASKWFILTIVGVILYITASMGFVTLQNVDPTEDQIEVPSHD